MVIIKWFCFNGVADGQRPSLASPLPPSTSNAIFGLSQIPAENVYGSLLFKILAASQRNSYYLLNENQAVVNAPLLWRRGALGKEGQTHSLVLRGRGKHPTVTVAQHSQSPWDEKRLPGLGLLKHFLFAEERLLCLAAPNLTSQSQRVHKSYLTRSEGLYLRHHFGHALLRSP